MNTIIHRFLQPEDNELEVEAMKGNQAKLLVIPSDWGHMGTYVHIRPYCWTFIRESAGGGSNEADMKFIRDHLHQFFKET